MLLVGEMRAQLESRDTLIKF